MKKSTKFLSVILALVMMFSMAMPSFAAIPSKATSVNTLLTSENLGSIVGWFLNNLNARKDKFVPTVLTLVDRYVDKIAAYIPAGQTVDTLSDEQKAKVLIDFCDAMLGEKFGDAVPENIVNLAGKLGITIDLKSVNGILKTLKEVDGLVSADLLGVLYGDINDLQFGALIKDRRAIQTSDGYLYVVKQLFQFLKDNTSVLQTVLNGNLELGTIIEGFFNPDEDGAFMKDPAGEMVSGGLNGSMKYLPTYVKNMIYDRFIDEDEMKAVVGRDWTADEMLGYAFINFITGKTDITKTDSAAVMTSSAYANLVKYAPVVYAKFAVEPLNGAFKNTLRDKVCTTNGTHNTLYSIINWSYAFTEADFNNLGITENTGILGGFNNMVYVVLQKILIPTEFAKIGLEKDTTAAKLNSNLTKLCRYLLPKMSGVVTGFDFSKFTSASVSKMTLEDMAVQVLKIFYPSWFHIEGDTNTLAFVNSIDSMPEMLAAAAYLGFPTDYYGARAGYKAILMNTAGNAVNSKLTEKQCVDTALDILMDKAVYELNYAKENTLFSLSADQVKVYKAAGWNWDDFADEIVDWALNTIKGIPAVADELKLVSGEYDGFGPFNKLNAIFNEFVDFSFMNNVSSKTPAGAVIAKMDFETFLLDGIIGNVCDFDIAGILSMFTVNKNSGNILNASFTSSVIGIANKALEAVFNHTCKNTSFKVASTCITHGYTETYCTTSGHIISQTSLPFGEHASDGGKITVNPTCTVRGKKVFTCKVCGKILDTKSVAALGHDMVPSGKVYMENGMLCQNLICANGCGLTQVIRSNPPVTTPTDIAASVSSTKISGNTVEGFYPGTTAAAFKKTFKDSSYLVIKDAEGNILKDTDIIMTGCKVSLIVNNKGNL